MPPGFSSASVLGVLFFREFDEHPHKKDHTSSTTTKNDDNDYCNYSLISAAG